MYGNNYQELIINFKYLQKIKIISAMNLNLDAWAEIELLPF